MLKQLDTDDRDIPASGIVTAYLPIGWRVMSFQVSKVTIVNLIARWVGNAAAKRLDTCLYRSGMVLVIRYLIQTKPEPCTTARIRQLHHEQLTDQILAEPTIAGNARPAP
jgi:hypothetical protein